MTDASDNARALGSIKTEKKAEAARKNLEKARERLHDPDVRAKHKAAQQARRKREKEEKDADTDRT